MITIDSSVFVAVFLTEDVGHIECVDIFRHIEERIILSHSIIHETTTVLAYKGSKRHADLFLDFIQNADNIYIVGHNIEEEIDLYEQTIAKISMVDISLVQTALYHRCDLWTLDKQLQGIAQKKGIHLYNKKILAN